MHPAPQATLGPLSHLRLYLPHAQPVGQRCPDLHCLRRQAIARGRRQRRCRAHVVQAVGQADEQRARVGAVHGDHHADQRALGGGCAFSAGGRVRAVAPRQVVQVGHLAGRGVASAGAPREGGHAR